MTSKTSNRKPTTNTLYPCKVTLIVELDNSAPVERVYHVSASSRDNAIVQAYRQLPRREHEVSHVAQVIEYGC